MNRLPALIFPLMALAPPAMSERCTYTTYQWNLHQQRAVNAHAVHKRRDDLEAREIDPATRCTVCEQDQVEIILPGVAPFKLCRHIAHRVEEALLALLEAGVPVRRVDGYRVGLTRGEADEQGNRTGFSNHSFGVALDINPQANGLYENCLQFGPQCRLSKGGEWDPADPESITPDGPVVKAMEAAGLRWGGRIEGRQKDFMHFSPTGY